MNEGRYRNQFAIRYDEIVPGRVLDVKPISADDRRFKIDVQAIDGRAVWIDVPILLPEGVTRCFRKGQSVAVAFRYGAAQYPVAIGHYYNLDADPSFADQMPPPLVNQDDQVYYHAETGAYIRMRSATSTPTNTKYKGGAASEPAILEIIAPSTTGGNPHRVLITQEPGSQAISVTSSLGHSVTMDDVAKTVATKSAGGHSSVMDDVAKTITHTTINGHLVKLDDVAAQIKMVTTGGEQHVLDAVKHEVSTIASSIGIGDFAHNLKAATGSAGGTLAAITQDHLTTLASNIDTKRLADSILFAGKMVAAGIPNAGAYLAQLQALAIDAIGKLGVPAGSATAFIKE